MPPYPLYGETTALPGSSVGSTLHTHSNKFPIEREVILSSADKNTKIPILQEYRRRERNKTMATIAPDAPNKLVAWTSANNSSGIVDASGDQRSENLAPLRPHQTYLTGMSVHQATATYSGGPHTGAVSRTYESSPRGTHTALPASTLAPASMLSGHNQNLTPLLNSITSSEIPHHLNEETLATNSGNHKLMKDATDVDKTKAFPTRTYHTLKGIISSRFNKSVKETPTDSTTLNQSLQSAAETSANNVTLNNMEKDVNKSMEDVTISRGGLDSEAGFSRLSANEGAYTRLAGAGAMGVVYAKVLDQSTGQGVKSDGPQSRAIDLVHAANQAVYAERNAVQTSSKVLATPSYTDRTPSSSQYAKPNTQQSSYSEQNAGIYMVMRQGGATNPMYQQRNGANGSAAGLTPGLNQSGVYSPTYSVGKQQQSMPNTHHTHGNEPKGGQIGPGLTYHQQSTPINKINGAVNGNSNFCGGFSNGEVNNLKACRLDSSLVKDDLSKKEDDSNGVKKGNGNVRKSKYSSSGIVSGSGQSSDYDKTYIDSGRGSAVSGQQMHRELTETSEESSTTAQGNDSEWVDLVESELRQILDPHVHHQGAPMGPNGGGNNSTVSDSISSITPPLPPLSPGGGANTRYKLTHNASGVYGIKQDYGPIDGRKTSQSQSRANASSRFNWNKSSDRNKTSFMGGSATDITSTTGTGLDSLLDDDVATSIATGDARAIRHQLEGLEHMYSQVLQLLGVKRQGMKGGPGQGYQPSDPRFNKRRFHGSVSSVPSSVSSRPIREKRRQDERKKVKDIKGINKRFQRLESHVVTLARSVAHLSSEMRTQHLMIQEMENIRSELSALRSHTLASSNRSQSMPRLTSNLSSLPALTNPTRVKKLTKFFGDEPPLLRLFLKKLGYEKYAGVFESERVGMVELPYMSEGRLQSMGIPLGPRLRILQEAHVSVLTTEQLCVL